MLRFTLAVIAGLFVLIFLYKVLTDFALSWNLVNCCQVLSGSCAK